MCHDRDCPRCETPEELYALELAESGECDGMTEDEIFELARSRIAERRGEAAIDQYEREK